MFRTIFSVTQRLESSEHTVKRFNKQFPPPSVGFLKLLAKKPPRKAQNWLRLYRFTSTYADLDHQHEHHPTTLTPIEMICYLLARNDTRGLNLPADYRLQLIEEIKKLIGNLSQNYKPLLRGLLELVRNPPFNIRHLDQTYLLNLSQITLSSDCLARCKIIGVRAYKTQFNNVSFTDADVCGADFTEARFVNGNCQRMLCIDGSLAHATFINTDLRGMNVAKTDVTGVDFSTAICDNMQFFNYNDSLPTVTTMERELDRLFNQCLSKQPTGTKERMQLIMAKSLAGYLNHRAMYNSSEEADMAQDIALMATQHNLFVTAECRQATQFCDYAGMFFPPAENTSAQTLLQRTATYVAGLRTAPVMAARA